MKFSTIIVLILFILFRNSFTLVKGKRDRKKVTVFIYWGRKVLEIVISFLIPILLLLDILKANINIPLFYIGIMFSVVGLFFMFWTRVYRDKDWGFMGDDSGDVLFTVGPYKFTRHPYYVGAFLVGLGIYLQVNYLWALLMIPVAIFMYHVIKKEDKFLEDKFLSKYIEYKNKVGIFPWFY